MPEGPKKNILEPPPPPPPLSTGQKQVNMAIKTNYGRQRVIQTVVDNAHKSL